MSLSIHHRRSKIRSFTLVEVLVAMAILLLILAVCSALTLAAQGMLNTGMERIDADAQARLFFDRFTIDMESMAKRTDVDYIIKDSTQTQTGTGSLGANDSLAFYAKATGYFTQSPDPAPRNSISLIAYRINSQTYQMERLAKGIGWNAKSSGTNMVFLPATPSNPGMQLYTTWPMIAGLNGGVPDLTLGDDPTDYQVLCPAIFRFEYCYILRDGTLSNVPWLSTETNKTVNGWQDVVGLYVAIAVLDERNRLVISSSAGDANLGTAVGAFPDFNLSTGTSPPLSQWESVINQPNLPSLLGLPLKTAQAVRIYARSIPINNCIPDLSL